MKGNPRGKNCEKQKSRVGKREKQSEDAQNDVDHVPQIKDFSRCHLHPT